MYKLKIITSTTRPGSKGIHVAAWMAGIAGGETHFETELLDLAKINLPLLDEPNHPRLRQYTHPHTFAWSETIGAADAFIIVLGEYNFGFPAPIKNALDYLSQEWEYKPVAFVSYGGISGGLRATQMLKQVVTTLKLVPMVEQVNLPFFAKHIDEQAVFQSNELLDKSARSMMQELLKWTKTLHDMRTAK